MMDIDGIDWRTMFLQGVTLNENIGRGMVQDDRIRYWN